MDILDRRRVYIVPTRPGFALFGVIGLILIGATNYDNALAYILSFLLLGLMFSAMLRTWRNLKGIALHAEDAAPVHAGMPARFELSLTDASVLARYAFSFRRLLPRSQRFWWWRPQTEGFGECPTIETGAALAVLSVPTVHRGWLVLGRVEVSSQFPLGMFRTWGYFKPSARCLVYPVAAGKLPLPGVTATAVDEAGSAGPGVDDFAGLRAYVAGDSLRSVHWKASARSEDLVVKQLQGGGHGDLWLRWVDTAALGGVEARISQLTRWVLEADRAGTPFGLQLPALELPPTTGPAHRERSLRALALMPT